MDFSKEVHLQVPGLKGVSPQYLSFAWMSFSQKCSSVLKDTKLLFQIVIAKKGRSGGGEKHIFSDEIWK